ncbi:DctP family TRAP transporter solute-binding subunit [Oceanispirochaeta crateris]|uniref:DctP family TRAP transporter solute-binding subunit n=2 Tax=Oceanispirochaeta crateris TaxID=2518645 RepID=A0A5C1QJP0_9SPIO|nr:DctP family TRAP transporter solute-binding subunit [Oceanispirochaeta crateris]
MTKRLISILMFFVALSGMAFANGQSEGTGSEDKVVTIKVNTISVPNDAHTNALYKFEEVLEELTEGKVQVEVFHSASLFSSEEEFASLLQGNLDMAYVSANTLADYIPSFSMLTSGYIFKDYDHMRKVYDGEIGDKILSSVQDELGIVPIDVFYLGARQINLRDIGRVVKTPADLKGVKLRMPNSAAWLFLGKAMGASATPLSFSELYLALKTGTVDGQDNPLPTVKNAKFYEVTKSISLTNHVIDTVWPTISEKKWKELTPYHDEVISAIEEAKQLCDSQNIEAEKSLVEFFRSEGLTVVEADKEAFSSHVQGVYLNDKKMTSTWDLDLYEQIQNIGK